MSIAELKRTADNLSAKERQWLRAYLWASERSGSVSWQKEIAEKRRKLKAGNGVSEVQYKRRTAGRDRKAS